MLTPSELIADIEFRTAKAPPIVSTRKNGKPDVAPYAVSGYECQAQSQIVTNWCVQSRIM